MSQDGDAYLRSLGVHRLAVPIPFADAGGPVNVYALEEADGGITLFDSGLGEPEAEASLRKSASEAGVDLKKIRRIIISHGHIDHYGLAEKLASESGATVHVHPLDWGKVVGAGGWSRHFPLYAPYFQRLGVPAGDVAIMGKVGRGIAQFAAQVDESRARRLEPPARIKLRHLELEVLHMPGHTPGLICLWDSARRILFADDHLLAKVSPNPLLELDPRGEEHKFRALETYFRSARRVYDLDIDWVLPGHGPPFQNHRALLDGLFAFYEKRQERIAARLAEGEATAMELVPVLFREVDVMRLFLTLSEVVGNLEVMETDGRVRRREVDGVYRYALA